MSEWTIEQAAELYLEQTLDLLDGCDDDDIVRPQIVWEALREVWAPGIDDVHLAADVTAGELRERANAARHALATGELIP